MSSSKHPKTTTPSDADLQCDPGIGQSKGLPRATGDADLAGTNTEEGDVGNDTTPSGGIDPSQRGRENK